MTGKDKDLMEELGEELCKHCPWTDFGTTSSMIHTPNGVIMCEGSKCDTALENYLEDTEDGSKAEEEIDWRNQYYKWKGDNP